MSWEIKYTIMFYYLDGNVGSIIERSFGEALKTVKSRYSDVKVIGDDMFAKIVDSTGTEVAQIRRSV